MSLVPLQPLIFFYRSDMSHEALNEHTKWATTVRSHQLLQLLCIYLKRNLRVSAAFEALQYVWNSTADPFLGFEEIGKAFERVLSPEEVDDLYSFYIQAVRKFEEESQPRSLEHICRINVRRILLECNRWIPDAVKQLGLPSPLQSYVNLEM
ncbi:hypothetical protein AVEN_173826-1 [Araneus ventricosus]|uniref:SOCS box domain-containing protein n=1 Tax=Araneus ventricosus TaxID=182803 RepID=A0A4Y2KIB0_ARAVE|nr:hypothetical protein AVEN_129411-1 [Araneus ventricosus]GBN02455.1 hypothetical protein AVEN_173826-1 [Araneus ventricosus]